MKSKYIRRIIEVVAWSLFLGFPLFIFPSLKPFFGPEGTIPAVYGILLTHSILIVFYYFNYYYALPKFYFTKKYKIYFPLVISILIAIILLLQLHPDLNPLHYATIQFAKTIFIFSIVVRFLMVFLLSLGFSAYSRLRQAEEEKLKTELSFLKAQINPHFLFNTLNSIYALAVKKSDSTPESVTKLAAIMRYVITDAAHDFVLLEKEINYVSSYIELEKLRLTQKVRLTYSVTGDPAGKQIAPLIFIPLIENAFKHGVSTVEDSTINIKIEIRDNTLHLKIDNTKVRLDKKNNNGLGIENVKKRLNLLYGGKHELKITENEKDFSVNLVVHLK